MPNSDLAELQNASLLKRLMSTLYDSLVLLAVSFVYFLCLTLVSFYMFGDNTPDYQPSVGGIGVQLGWAFCLITFYCFFWLKVGQTVAMKAWKIKLVSDQGELTLPQCVLRCALGFASLLCFGLGYVWILFDRDNLALHDRLSRTRVVVLPKELA